MTLFHSLGVLLRTLAFTLRCCCWKQVFTTQHGTGVGPEFKTILYSYPYTIRHNHIYTILVIGYRSITRTTTHIIRPR